MLLVFSIKNEPTPMGGEELVVKLLLPEVVGVRLIAYHINRPINLTYLQTTRYL